MFDDVIIAVSDDESALDALALGRALAPPGAALTLVHVEQGGADRETPQEPPAPLASLSDGPGGAAHPLVVVGASSPAAGLHDVASRGGADLLVIGTPRHRGLGRAHAEAMIRDAPCAVSALEVVTPRPLRDPLNARNEIDDRVAAGRRRLAGSSP